MKIAVTTPTGHVGRHIVAMLIRAGVRPTVLVRDPSRLDASVRDLVDAVTVDLGDSDAVVAATAGVNALFWIDPPTDAPDPIAEYARIGGNAARAVTTNGIARTVFQSSIGAEKRHGAGEIDGLARTEELLDATGASVLHLRCGFFFTNLLLQLDAVRSGVLPVVLPTDQPMAWVAPRDIAEVATHRLLSTEWFGRHVHAVHGPADLSWDQAAAIVADATGRPLRAEQIPDDDMRQTLRESGMDEGLVEAIMGMSTGLRDGFTPEQSRDVTTTTPTTLASWSYDVLRPLL
ncbi:NmrA family NAD(P)-binding protein [Streptomyces sp. H27-D2]|uniref:NmrA family NAD(P)-binding protein n=1 Tax=Streptomyces sp. H27-D2 TaxID=3046304 RepID=UPI002DB90712|nr:NAD(P)H-binding protein [Streptomyces sp. H27-D2]MEC4019605.1 NAD(P)H-binding protein [Streptomyces sp. H27-D2]